MIRRRFIVAVPPERAFRVWTGSISGWWPPSHHLSGDPAGTLLMEPRVGGRFYERTAEGNEFEYGRVLAFEPPTLLAYSWFPGSGVEHPTRVEVRFTPIAEGTQVDVQHAPGTVDRARFDQTAERYRRGWDLIVSAFQRVVEEP